MRDMLGDYHFLKGWRRGCLLGCVIGIAEAVVFVLLRPGDWLFAVALCVIYAGLGAFIWLYGLANGFGKW